MLSSDVLVDVGALLAAGRAVRTAKSGREAALVALVAAQTLEEDVAVTAARAHVATVGVARPSVMLRLLLLWLGLESPVMVVDAQRV